MGIETRETIHAEGVQEGVKKGLQEAIAIVQQLGKGSNGQPLTPGFIAFKLDQHLKEKG